MLAGAVQQFLKAQGLSPVMVGGFGDYTSAGAPAYAVHAESDGDRELSGGIYGARLQIRTRAADMIAAENAGREALGLLRSARGQALPWTDPTGGPNRSYFLNTLTIVNRPTWLPTPEPGEETSCNLRLLVQEVP